MIELLVYGVPASKGSSRGFAVPVKGQPGKYRAVVTSTNKNLKDWEHRIASAAQVKANGQLMAGPIELQIEFVLPRPKKVRGRDIRHVTRPDCSKLVRGAEDALNKVIWGDDGQVARILAEKRYANESETPHARIRVTPLAVCGRLFTPDPTRRL